jgi:hypothetical protein
MDSPEMLVALMVVLGLTGIALTVWLVRYIIRGLSNKNGSEPSSAQISEAEVVERSTADVPQSLTQPQEDARPVAGRPDLERGAVPTSAAPEVWEQESALESGDRLLMRLWQDGDGFLVVELDGQRYRRLFDIRDGEVGRRVMAIINRLVAFSKGQESRATSEPVPDSRAPVQTEATVRSQSRVYLEQLQQPEVESKKPLITADPVPFRRRSDAQNLHITLNLAKEIDELVQIRIRALPEFSQRYIHVVNAVDGGLGFQVDGVRYGEIDAIPDPQVQTLIRTAISDWEDER